MPRDPTRRPSSAGDPLPRQRSLASPALGSRKSHCSSYARLLRRHEMSSGKAWGSAAESHGAADSAASPVYSANSGGGWQQPEDAADDERLEELAAIRALLPTADPGSADSERAQMACRRLLRRVDALLSTIGEGHYCYGDALLLSSSLRRSLQLFRDMSARYPKRPDGAAVLSTAAGAVALRWETQPDGLASMTLDGRNLLELDADGELSLCDNNGVPYLTIMQPSRDGSVGAMVSRHSVARAVAAVRSLLGAAGLGASKEWHAQTYMPRHSWHMAAAEWHDLTTWIGAPVCVRNLFTLT
eukprot:TRINITY_DN8248_c0_g1_i1.p1 TRINITY_DN8248_c0_g1~~TRINITY_DN8248_c0_g1_i1.p1  ORF type:complete len:301 (+),score=71.35 TRINITY_DN8248_c0_g1_i1:77-979(+)